jgi:acetyltransferase-like isoleucine patch superfamily enzyme
VSSNCYIQGFNGIFIGDNTIFSSGVGIISANHGFKDLNTSVVSSSIKIGKNCWLGKNAIILPGVTLGDNCIVGAGAVVTKSFDKGSVIAGVPANLLRYI